MYTDYRQLCKRLRWKFPVLTAGMHWIAWYGSPVEPGLPVRQPIYQTPRDGSLSCPSIAYQATYLAGCLEQQSAAAAHCP